MDINFSNMVNNAKLQNNNTKSLENRTNNAKTSDNDKALMEACREFESVFTHMLLKNMRSTVQDGGLTEKSTGREIFEDMHDQEMAGIMSKSNSGIGLAKVIYEQMKYKR